jgi:hypothetical protein
MATRSPQGRAAPPAAAAPPLNGLDEFSQQLAERFPGRVLKRFVMPSSIVQCREVFMLELTSRDEVSAAIFTDTILTAIERASYRLTQEAEQRECIRLAIVGLGSEQGGKLAYRHTNLDPAVPLAEISDWPAKAWVALHQYFRETNGVPQAEIDEGIRGAQIVGAFYAPKRNETQASADIGRSDESSGANT